MDAYIRIAENLLTPGYIITTTENDDVVVNDNCIAINTSTWNSCPAENELYNILTKRLDSKRRGHAVQLSAIAACTLCSRGYVINHTSMSGLSDNDMKAVWGFMETSIVSSSGALSKWMRKAVDGRSQDGYCASTDSVTCNSNLIDDQYNRRTANPILKPKSAAQPVNANVAALQYGGGPTITDLAIADSIMLQRLRFKEGLPPPLLIGPTWSIDQSSYDDA